MTSCNKIKRNILVLQQFQRFKNYLQRFNRRNCSIQQVAATQHKINTLLNTLFYGPYKRFFPENTHTLITPASNMTIRNMSKFHSVLLHSKQFFLNLRNNIILCMILKQEKLYWNSQTRKVRSNNCLATIKTCNSTIILTQ